MNTNTAQVAISNVDRLGFLNEQIKLLTDEAEKIKNEFKEEASLSGVKAFLGSMFVATYTESNRGTFDYKKLISDLNLNETQVKAYTKICAVYSIKTSQL
jgi:hypothetical protein